MDGMLRGVWEEISEEKERGKLLVVSSDLAKVHCPFSKHRARPTATQSILCEILAVVTALEKSKRKDSHSCASSKAVVLSSHSYYLIITGRLLALGLRLLLSALGARHFLLNAISQIRYAI